MAGSADERVGLALEDAFNALLNAFTTVNSPSPLVSLCLCVCECVSVFVCVCVLQYTCIKTRHTN